MNASDSPPALGELARLAIDDVNEYASAYYAYVMHGAGSGRKTAMDAAYNAFADKLDALVALASGGAAMREAMTAAADELENDPKTRTCHNVAAALRAALTPERPADA